MTAKQLQHLGELAELAADFFTHSDPLPGPDVQRGGGGSQPARRPLEHEEMVAGLAERSRPRSEAEPRLNPPGPHRGGSSPGQPPCARVTARDR